MSQASQVSRVAGVFVGGQSRRMRGVPKGLLRAPSGERIVERLVSLFTALGVQVVFVGDATAYRELPCVRAGAISEALDDDPPGIGPLGGLIALLRYAERARAHAVAVACDMPYLSRELLARLLIAVPAQAQTGGAGPAIVAPRRDGRWEPMLARYDPAAVLPCALARVRSGSRAHGLQGLFDEARAVELSLSANEELELRDWDAPSDIEPGPR